MSRAGAGLAAVALAGCFSIPPYEPRDGVSYTAAGTGATVAGARFELSFAGGDGFHFPDALRIDGTDVMGRDPAQGCFREDEIGVLIAPTARISATGPAEPVTSRLETPLRGPAVVQVKVEWTTRFECASTRKPGGASTFTVFPDGRIVRHDAFFDPGTTTLLPSRCACEPPIDSKDMLFNLSTYWTLARSAGLVDIFLPGEDSKPLPTSDGGNLSASVSCVNGGGYQVGFAWPGLTNTRIRGTGASIVLDRQFDIGAGEITTLSEQDRSAIFIEHGGCAAALARAQAHIARPELTINEAAEMPAENDGIYGGGDQQGVEVPDGPFELRGPTPGSFAVWLRFPRPADAVRATRKDAKGGWYVPQKVDDRSWIVWFREPLLADETISIEPD